MPLLPGLSLDVCGDAEAMSARAAALIAERLRATPGLLLCAATGSTPTRAYAHLTAACAADPTLAGQLRVVKLDEWGGLPPDDPGTCEAYLLQHLVGPLGLGPDRYFGFQSDAPEPEAECTRLRERLAAEGPIDLSLLGLGLNGHLALNEPAAALRPHAHTVPLAAETRGHVMIRHLSSPPSFGFTLGLAEILQSREILLLVSGAHKRDVLRRVLESPVSTQLPASFLHLHPRVTVLCDGEAAG